LSLNACAWSLTLLAASCLLVLALLLLLLLPSSLPPHHRPQLRMGCRPLPYGSTNNEAEYSGLIAGMRVSTWKTAFNTHKQVCGHCCHASSL
jgi:hypothetical protein